MAVDDCNIDERDFEDLNLDDLEKLPSGLSCFNGFPESQLCVPPDATEDPEWFPSFSNDFISLSDVVLLSDHESFSFEEYELPSFNFPITPPEQHNEKTKEQTERMKLISHQTSSEANDHWIGFGRADFDGIKMKKSRTKKRCTKLENQKTKWSLAVNAVRKRCSHCQTDQTPQWRTGPMGPKTLCNACGVRFKSGRLVPEYRPAASPTFDSGRHSNFHKKILKRRGLISVNN